MAELSQPSQTIRTDGLAGASLSLGSGAARAHPSELDALLDAAEVLIRDSDGDGASIICRGLADLRERLGAQRLHFAILGQFKRGKSMVLNALLGEPLLPTGVVPVTAIPTRVQSGPLPRVRISFRDGCRNPEEFSTQQAAELQQHIRHFVAEDANPNNRLDVDRVDVFLPAPMLGKGLVVIDTPGIGSTLRHNTDATLAFLPQCDVALFIVSADPPLTQAEAEFLGIVAAHVPHLAFVLNKIDLIDAAERQSAFAFLRDVLHEQAHVPLDVRIFCVSARQALEAKQTGSAACLAQSGFEDLEAYLTQDLARGKSGLLQVAVARKAAALVAEGLMMMELSVRSLQLPLFQLEERLQAFEYALEDFARQRHTSKDVLAGDRSRILESLETRAEDLRQRANHYLAAVMDQALTKSSDSAGVQKSLASAIPLFFDQALRDLSGEVTQLLDLALSRHQESAHALVENIRAQAAQIFEIPYRPLERETVLRGDREPYWVTHDIRGLLDPISESVLSRLLPLSLRNKYVRRSLLERIDTLACRNVENLRWALRQNIDDAFRRFGNDLDAQFSAVITALHGAIRSAMNKRQGESPVIEAETERLSAAAAALATVQARLEVAAGRTIVMPNST